MLPSLQPPYRPRRFALPPALAAEGAAEVVEAVQHDGPPSSS